MSLERRPLGNSGKTISAIGLGCVTYGREIGEDDAMRVMDYAFETGVNFWDTAEGYGVSEVIIGKWIKSRGVRDQVTICTKVSKSGKPEYVKQAVQNSLERLGVERLDIYKLHAYFKDAPIEETLAVLDEEVRAGRIDVIGGSNFKAENLREALAVSDKNGYARIQILQPPYALADSTKFGYISREEAELDLFPLCVKEGVAVTPYSPLAAGFLSGKYLEARDRSQFPKGTRFDVAPAHAEVYFNDENFRRTEKLKAKAEELGEPMVKLAMTWAMTNPMVTSIIAGARKPEHVDNAIEAYHMGMSAALRAEISDWR